jgi:hypothetical protein
MTSLKIILNNYRYSLNLQAKANETNSLILESQVAVLKCPISRTNSTCKDLVKTNRCESAVQRHLDLIS